MPDVVAAVLDGVEAVELGGDGEGEDIDMSAVAPGVDDGVIIGARSGDGVTLPHIFSADVGGEAVNLYAAEGEGEVEDTVASSDTGNRVGVIARGGVSLTVPCIGTSVDRDGLVDNLLMREGKVEYEEGVVGCVDEHIRSVVGVSLAIDVPDETFASDGVGSDEDTAAVVLSQSRGACCGNQKKSE